MPMNPNFLCCIGAELKNSTQQTTRMSQVYLYRAFEDDTLSDMLSAGFFNAAMGIIRQDDLLLLYSPNETTAKYTYARVSNVSSSGVVIEQIGIDATQIIVDTTGFSNLSGNNLQEILNNLDTNITTINNAFVKKDGSSIMTGPLKMRSGSMQGAIAPYWDGIGLFKLNSDNSVTLLASMEATDGLCPAANNTYNLGKANYKWKDAYIARVITAVINNGYDIAVPVTNGPDTLALKSEVDTAANSGRMITDQGVWFAKMYAATIPPAADDGTNYADFSQTDGDGNPIIVIYERQSGAWVQSQTITPPANYDGYVPVTKKIWDIVEQTGQNGGRILWNHQSKEFTPYPNIVSFEDIEVTGDSTVDMPASPSTQQIVNKNYVDSQIAASAATKANVGMDNLTSTGQNIANWSSNVTNCITEIPQDIKLELNNGTLTLKAGSKVYVPNGSGVFNTVTTTADASVTRTDNQKCMVWCYPNGTLGIFPINLFFSGTTAPTGYTFMFWYDTTNNLCKYTSDGGSTWAAYLSLPICVVETDGTKISAIDHVFNGFGYVGSTIFILPNTKGLVPNGRNTDGTLKTISVTTSSVITRTGMGTNVNYEAGLNTGYYINYSSNYTLGDDGFLHVSNGTIRNDVVFATYSTGADGRITSFAKKSVFHAVDYNDSEYIANCAMPSEVVISLYSTLPVTNTKIAAPADGYMCVAVRSGAAGQYISLSKGIESTQVAYTTNQTLTVSIPVSKGQEVTLFHNITGSMVYFRFIYANGAVEQ